MKTKITLLTILLAALFSINSSAQPKYTGDVTLGYAFGAGLFSADAITITTTHGAKLSDHFSVGAGLGVHYFYDAEFAAMPIYANAKVYAAENKLTPYGTFDIGYAIGLNEGSKGEVYTNVGVGLLIKKFKVQVTYNYIGMSAIQLGVGIAF